MLNTPSVQSSSPLALVCWRGSDGLRTTSSPLSRETAEALVRAYATFFPRQDCWVEPLPAYEPAPRTPRRAPRGL